MAWDEWQQLKAEALAQPPVGMQLNADPEAGRGGGGAGGAGGQGDLAATHTDLAEVGASAYKLFDGLGNHGRDAWSSSQGAARDLTAQGFALGGGLDHVQDRWEKQLKTLLDACAHISNHMNFTQKVNKGAERQVLEAVSGIAVLDEGFADGGKREGDKG
ncbi:hypothetical protein ACH4SP_33935 [Streptomyces sp. NPDC021093]|uniref:hypothetical protein n=1 Tax=Streptomyces sp. NPDC021093 TaxID=3365112 RepID=UPI0037AE983F